MARRSLLTARPPRPEVQAFLRDVKEHPADDAPRLVLADWLDEHGDDVDRDRAALLRAGCLAPGLPADDPRRQALERQGRAAEEASAIVWLGPLYQGGVRWSFQRGLIHLEMNVRWLVGPSAALWAATEAWAWVERVVLTNVCSAHLPRLAQSPALATLPALSLRCLWSYGMRVEELAASPHLANLGSLEVIHMGDPVLTLVRSPHLGRLTALRLLGNDLGNKAVPVILGLACAERLTALSITGGSLDAEGARQLAASPRLANLTELDLRYNRIGNAGMQALLESPHLGKLKRLDGPERLSREVKKALSERFGASSR